MEGEQEVEVQCGAHLSAPADMPLVALASYPCQALVTCRCPRGLAKLEMTSLASCIMVGHRHRREG